MTEKARARRVKKRERYSLTLDKSVMREIETLKGEWNMSRSRLVETILKKWLGGQYQGSSSAREKKEKK